MTRATDSRATATLSGRELALKRRKAMAMHGKNGVVKAAAANPSAGTRMTTGASGQEPAGATAVAGTTGRDASRARRQALSLAGKAAMQVSASAGRRERPQAAAEPGKPCGCSGNGAQRTGDVPESAALAPAAAMPEAGVAVSSGRALARARRNALSQDGKAGLRHVAQVTRRAATPSVQDGEVAGVNGRQVAMQRRMQQSLQGRTAAKQTDARPAGRLRARKDIPAPPKVEQGHTLAGRPVTGTLVEGSKKVTGNEAGACHAITGTGYVGVEQFDQLCVTGPVSVPGRPGSARNKNQNVRERGVTGTSVSRSEKVTGNEPASNRAITGTEYAAPSYGPAPVEKVVVTHTIQGKPVTGTAVGPSRRMTGDEDGVCHSVTGTEYLSMEALKRCNTELPRTPRKVSVMSSREDQPVSGTAIGRSAKVTGDEAGSCRSITGSQYYVTDPALCNAPVPGKVASMRTWLGRTVTGTEIVGSREVTGDEAGACKPVTGTDYLGPDQQAAVCDSAPPVAPVEKVAVDQTWRGQPVTGSYVGRSTKVTGDEHGGCAPISGTPYIGRGQYNRFCETPAQQAQDARVPDRAQISATAVTGDRPGAGGSVMTGDERGSCEVVSGTPYVGVDNSPTQCATSGRFVSRAALPAEPPRPPAPEDFSIMTPARAARQKGSGGVTGTGYNSERITGPVNKAGGLITGTPEFRHQDAVATVAEQETAVSAARRLTGEGSQAGREITGDAWNAKSRVTGTEGASSQGRNPSERGQPRGMGMNAARFRDHIEPTPVPPSRITGSSGNTGTGALVTVSGGARG
ncbi:MAG: CsoS2 family carboxysome shell protein [Acidiferrobacteraceae bacterium]